MPDKYFHGNLRNWTAEQGGSGDTLQSAQVSASTGTRQLMVWLALLVGIVCILMVAGFDVGQVAANARDHADRVTLADL